MATVHVAAGQDDVSYSHTLKKLLRVNVEKNSGTGDGSRQLNRAFGQTGISRASMVSRYDPAIMADGAPNLQGRGPGSPRGQAGPTRGGPHRQGPSAAGVLAPGTNVKPNRRVTYHPLPEPPASFMRTAFSAPVPQRRRQRRSSIAESPPGSGGGGAAAAAAGTAPTPGKEKSTLTAAAHLLVPPVRRVSSVSGGQLAAMASAAAAAAGGMFGEDSAGSGGGHGLSANPYSFGARVRHNSGVSNLSYKPPANVTAEPAAAVLQRRRAAFQAARGGGGLGSPIGSGGGSFLFAGGAATATAAATAGGGNGGNLLRGSSWGSPPNSLGASGALSMQLLSLGLGSSAELEHGVKAADGDDGAAGGGGAGGALGPFAAAFGGEAGGPGSDMYDSVWPLSAGWRMLGMGTDGDGDVVRTSADVAGMDSAGMGMYIRPATSPVLANLLRRSGGAVGDGGGGSGGGGGGGGGGTPVSGARPSPFAPPMQLYYMKSAEDEDDGPGGPVATVATAAAKAGRVPPSPTPSSVAERPSTRIPNLDLALLRPAISAPTAGGGGGGGGTGTGSGGGGTGTGGAAARPSQLVKCDSDLGQDCHETAGEEEADGPSAAAANAAAAAPPPPQAAAAAAPAVATRTSGEAPKSYTLRTAPSNPATPMGGPANIFKAQTPDKAPPGAAAGSGTPDKAASGTGGSGTVPAGAAAAAAAATGGSGAGGAAEAGGGGGGGDADAAARKRRSSARGGNASLDGEPSTGATGVYVMGDTTKMLQVGVSVTALLEIVKALPPTTRFATTAEIFEQWLAPPTRNSQCRFLDLVMARVKIILGDQPEGGVQLTPGGPRGSTSGMPVLHPDRTWFGPPDHYVIHCWSGNFQALVAALREYCGAINRTPSSTYVWLDVMAANHHPGRKDKKELPHCKQIMATARKALLVLDPMAHSLTRLWCLYEIWLAACAVPGASPSKLTLLNGGADWDAFADSFFRIDLSRCATSNPDDRARLLEDMIRTSHDNGSGSGSQPASGTTISPYGVVAALPQLSAAVRSALFDAAAGDVWEARKGARAGGTGMMALLDAVERYAMIRRLAGGHVEAEEQLETAVSVAMGVSGGRVPNSARPSSPGPKGAAAAAAAAAANGAAAGGGGGGGGGTEAAGEVTVSGGIGSVAVKADPTAAWGADAGGGGGGGEFGGGVDLGGGGGSLELPPSPPSLSLPPIHPTRYSSTTLTSSNPINRSISPAFGVPGSSGRISVEPEDDFLAAAAATAAAAAAAAAAVTANANANGGNALSNAAAWRKKPATLAALALLQAEHGRLIQASTHAAMALSCVPGLALMRPAAPTTPEKDTDSDELYEYGGGGGGAGGGGGGGGGGGRNLRSARDHQSFHIARQRSGSPPMQHYQSIRSRTATYDNGGGGGELDRRGGQRGGGGGGGGRDGREKEPSSPPPTAGDIAWKGSYWELTSPQNITTDATRAIFMASMVEAACGRHEAATQLALQAGHARAAALGPAHPATLATRRAAVSHLLALGRVVEAQILARSLLREAVAEHGEVHPSVGICHGAVAMVLAAQNKAEQAYSSAQRGAEVLASTLGRGHPATLDALQLCADMLESAREYGKAVALMRLVVQGRSAPGAIRASPASPAFLAPNNRLLHLRTIAALEEKAVSEEHSRRAMIGVMRNLARLESELRAALMAMTGAAKQTQMLIQRDLELVLMAQNKRYEAAMLRKGELRPA